MAVLNEILVLASLFVGAEAARCYNYYYNTYTYYCTYYYSYYDSSPGGIVGGVVGGLFGLGTLIALIVACVCCRRRQASAGQVIGNRNGTSVTMVTQQNTAYPAGQPGFTQPATGQVAYPAAPMGQYGSPTPAGAYPTQPQQPYPVGTQPYPQQTPAYNPGNAYDPNMAPMAGGGQVNPGFQPPPPYDSLPKEKQ